MSQQQTLSAGEVIVGVAIGIAAIAVIDAIVNHPQDVLDVLVKITPSFPLSPLPAKPNSFSAQWPLAGAGGLGTTRQPVNSLAKPGFKPRFPLRHRAHNNRFRLTRVDLNSFSAETPVAKTALDVKPAAPLPKHEQILTLFYSHLDETGKKSNAGLSYTKEFTAFIQPVRKALAEEQRKVNSQSSPHRPAGRPEGAIDPLTAQILELKGQGRTSEDIAAITYEGHSLNSKAFKIHKAKVGRLLKYHSQKSAGCSTAVDDGTPVGSVVTHENNN
jgi:hypothetical protein